MRQSSMFWRNLNHPKNHIARCGNSYPGRVFLSPDPCAGQHNGFHGQIFPNYQTIYTSSSVKYFRPCKIIMMSPNSPLIKRKFVNRSFLLFWRNIYIYIYMMRYNGVIYCASVIRWILIVTIWRLKNISTKRQCAKSNVLII